MSAQSCGVLLAARRSEHEDVLCCSHRATVVVIYLFVCSVSRNLLTAQRLEVAVFAESAEFQMAKSKYSRKAEHLQQIVKQQRARLEQTSLELYAAEKEVRLSDFFIVLTNMPTFHRFQSSSRHHQY